MLPTWPHGRSYHSSSSTTEELFVEELFVEELFVASLLSSSGGNLLGSTKGMACLERVGYHPLGMLAMPLRRAVQKLALLENEVQTVALCHRVTS